MKVGEFLFQIMSEPPQKKLEDWFFYGVIIALLILPYICKKIHVFVYFGKYLLYCSTISVIAVACIPFFALNAKNVKNCL